MEYGRDAAASDAGRALTEALGRFWVARTYEADLQVHGTPLPVFIQANGSPSCSISHVTLRQWMLKVRDALSPSQAEDERSGRWLVVAIVVSPCSIEESALMLLAAEHRDWIYVPIDAALPLDRQLELLRTARADRVVTLPRSPLALLFDGDQAGKGGVVAPVVLALGSVLVPPDCDVFQTVQVIALERNPEESLQAAVAFSLEASSNQDGTDETAGVPAPLYVLCTSGSTGEPKGVLGTRAGAWNRMRWMWARYPFSAREERVVRDVKLTFVDSVWEILGAFLQRVPLVHVAAPLTFDDGSADVGDSHHVVLSERCHFLERAFEHCVTRFTVVPSVLEVLLVQKSRRDLQSALTSLRYLLISGETLPLKLVLQLSDILPRVTVLNLYGA